jgi:hypothetical protein
MKSSPSKPGLTEGEGGGLFVGVWYIGMTLVFISPSTYYSHPSYPIIQYHRVVVPPTKMQNYHLPKIIFLPSHKSLELSSNKVKTAKYVVKYI